MYYSLPSIELNQQINYKVIFYLFSIFFYSWHLSLQIILPRIEISFKIR